MSFIAKYTLVLVAVFLAMSCATHDPYTFRFDPDTTADEQAAAIRAFGAWNDAGTLSEDHMSDDPDGEWRITFTTDLSPGLDGRTCHDLAIDGDCAHARWIRIRRGLSPERTLAVVTHECGHAIWLDHVKDPSSVMNQYSPTSVISAVDIDECVRVGSCGSVTITRAP